MVVRSDQIPSEEQRKTPFNHNPTPHDIEHFGQNIMEKTRKIMKNINKNDEKKYKSILTCYVCVQYRSMTVVHPAIGCESVALSQGFLLAAQQIYATTRS